MNYNEPHCIALKYEGKDTVYQKIEQSTDTTGLYYHILSSEEKDSLTQMINRFPWHRHRSKDINVYSDAKTYFFIVKRAKSTELVCVRGKRFTTELQQFGDSLKMFCTGKPFYKTSKKIPFWGNVTPIPPPPPPPIAKEFIYK